MSIVADPLPLAQQLQHTVAQFGEFLATAVEAGAPVHEVERGLWQQRLRLGQQLVRHFFALLGDGDQGATIARPGG